MVSLFCAAVALRTQSPRTKSAAEIYRSAKGAVVTVTTSKASGTGFCVRGDLVVTAWHVVKDDFDSIHIDRTGLRAVRLVGFDEVRDVAVLQASRTVGAELRLRRGPAPSSGESVYAIGNPLGFLNMSISEGIVSGVRRIGNVALIQITAPVSHGSSGGPVLDDQGRVVGIVHSLIDKGQGLNFATSAYDVSLALIGFAAKTNFRGRPRMRRKAAAQG